jgi:hypothetical protein
VPGVGFAKVLVRQSAGKIPTTEVDVNWQERLRQMVLAGGVLVAGCGGDRLGASGTGGNNGSGGTGGTAGMSGTANTGGTAGTSGTGGTPGTGGIGFPCGNANPDPCICGRPEASAAAADLCALSMACNAVGGELLYSGMAVSPICERDGGVVDLSDGAAPKMDGGARD